MWESDGVHGGAYTFVTAGEPCLCSDHEVQQMQEAPLQQLNYHTGRLAFVMQIHQRHCAGIVTTKSSRTSIQLPTDNLSFGLPLNQIMSTALENFQANSITPHSPWKGSLASDKCLSPADAASSASG